ncbi:toll/interleukin-1 receptor domain-containing protein [Streptomyces spirodelae]|uniref:Toll/interleukin-1 receptor domain-containing protein n=1 Tax=Streptomyces spirodelae TaxID=2812904 RepID=A0ABS3WX94_9ACTN|nr:toll/interleukin-1 receptor domain-containing protein [Streptomyces spirodelae]MBO8187752.1 toll/interleukin-1 receptor domain-containing protein [Streptomyces spirodelae]
MPHVFVNYRTGDGEQAATTVARDLTHRFGPGLVFRASESIRPGQLYPEELLAGVRRSDALLALIGPNWLEAPDVSDPDSRALDNPEDWVRKEILEALSNGLPVIPVLLGRRTERLTAAALPRPLARLAYVQSLRYDHQQAGTDLDRIAEVLSELVPGLEDSGTPEEPAGATHDTVTNSLSGGGDGHTQARDISGGLNSTVIRESHGPVNSGSGPQNVHQPHLDGDGSTYISGDNEGGVNHRFGGRR